MYSEIKELNICIAFSELDNVHRVAIGSKGFSVLIKEICV